MNLKNKKIFVTGHNGMVGSAIVRYLSNKNYKKIITIEKNELNLLSQRDTEKFIKKIKPDYVINAAARVGGILANQNFKANFIYENLMIQTNIIHSSFKAGVKKLLFLGSSCIYPKFSKQPIKEDYLLTGKLEETNDAYAIAKIAGIKMCEAYNNQYNLDYLCLMPTNLYGPNDNYNLMDSHFFPALIKKILMAKKKKLKHFTIWGDGKVKREIMYVDDLASACEYFLNKKTEHSLINIGSGEERTIKDFAKFILERLKIDLKIRFDKSKPNGTPRKIVDTGLAKKYGWKPKFSLEKGFDLTKKDFLNKNII